MVAHLDLRWKRRLGKGAYILDSFACLGCHRPRRFAVHVGGVAMQFASLAVARAHFYAGRFVLARESQFDEKRLHGAVFPDSSRLAAVRYLAAVITGTLRRQQDVTVRPTAEIQLIRPVGAPIRIDGDARAHLPVRIRLAVTPIDLIPWPVAASRADDTNI